MYTTLTKGNETRTIEVCGRVVISSLVGSTQLPRRRTCVTAAEAQAEAEQQARYFTGLGWTRS